MKRRAFLSGVGLSMTALAGCVGGLTGSGGTQSSGTSPEGYETIAVEGEQIALVPVDETHQWHQNEEATFVDARGSSAYNQGHITNAMSSPVQTPIEAEPIEGVSKDTRIVSYCGCPHHLSSLRAAELQKAGYTNVYVIDEGFYEWVERGYPVTGSSARKEFEIRGQTDSSYAGEMVMLWLQADGETQPLEAAPIQEDGSYAITVHFSGVTADSVVSLEAPDYQLETTLGALTEQVVTAESVRTLE
ncbi:rhodanese-like domain-containing protein [Haloarchaeobius sp. HME9146]|uniref:rhodanese-like domain-containing protein n=1 Tax=Haloarchaeobius sp. HME9146 TaxID=2978732 RepID=UPI0021C1D248|nr:rhodanese-like domain-containing protein [Haloarchaeobius sp. HME9146]MCT9094836.1 rhodanese-like domain-containing protein [Haloarchaeobius sp. HME9146]